MHNEVMYRFIGKDKTWLNYTRLELFEQGRGVLYQDKDHLYWMKLGLIAITEYDQLQNIKIAMCVRKYPK